MPSIFDNIDSDILLPGVAENVVRDLLQAQDASVQPDLAAQIDEEDNKRDGSYVGDALAEGAGQAAAEVGAAPSAQLPIRRANAFANRPAQASAERS